nr:dorsal [Sogatella furcifera]
MCGFLFILSSFGVFFSIFNSLSIFCFCSARRRSSASNHPLLVAARGGGEGVVLGGTAIMNRHVICVITEQPASKALRFRYECEGRSAGSIPGISSTPENKTFPTIQIEGYKGRAVVVVSCVTKDSPYKPHPHSLVGKEGCKHGVCTMEVNTETMSLSFANLGIQCIKKKDIDNALNQREKLRIDPFKTGYEHKNQPGSIDLNAVRLCFQVFLEGKVKNQFNVAITPVVSEPIYDKKAMSDLVICKLSEDSAPVVGGKQIILLCEKVAKEDISVRLFEEVNNQTVWEGQCDFQTTDVHKQVAITFRTPRYRNIDVTDPILVQIQLVRPSDKAASEPLPFQLTPIQSGRGQLVWSLNRRRKADYRTFASILNTDARLTTTNRVGGMGADKDRNKVITLDAVGEEMSVEGWGKGEGDEDDGKADPDRWKKINDAYAELKKGKRGRMVGGKEGGEIERNQGGNLAKNDGNVENLVGNNGVFAGNLVNNHGNTVGGGRNDGDTIGISENDGKFGGNMVEGGENDGKFGGNIVEVNGNVGQFDGNLVENFVVNNQNLERFGVGSGDFVVGSDGTLMEGGNVIVIDGNILENNIKRDVEMVDSSLEPRSNTEGFTDLLNQVNELDSFVVDGNDFGIYSSLQLAMKNPCEFIDNNSPMETYEDIAPPRPTASKPPLPLHQSRVDVKQQQQGDVEDVEGVLPPLPPKRVKKGGSPPQKTLPPTPEATKKLSLFQKLFSSSKRGSKSRKNSVTSSSRKPSVTSLISRRSVVAVGEGEGEHEKQPELTEAEHYALYTSLAPHATASEFDEMSFYYSPVEGRAPSIGMRRKRAKYDVVQELEATNAKLLQCDGTLVKQEDQQAGGYWKASPVYGGAPSPAGAPGASPDYTNLATGMAGPSTAAYGGLVYAPPPAFSPAGSVASPAEHQASVSPLPQMGHPLDQMNNLSMIQQQVNIDNNLNIIQPQHNIVQQHSPMQHNIMQQNSPISNIVDNMMQQQHSPMSNIVDNMIQQQQQHSPMSNIVDNIIQQHSPLQQHNNMSQQPTQGSMCQQVVDSMQQQNNICQQVNIAQQQSNMCQQVDNMAQQGSMCQQHVVMDMDTQQHSIELSAGRLDSRDLRDLDLDSVSENLSANLILNEVAGTSESMTDSLGRIPSNSLLYYNQSNGNGFPSQGGSSNML